ncbi:MAG: ABC transporter permease, partial [Acidobacteria bacterium]|nr:ABC transporter permease [Acidobacteriota bacterium]
MRLPSAMTPVTKTLAIARFEFTSIVLRRSYIISNFVLPLLLVLIVGGFVFFTFVPKADAVMKMLDQAARARVGVVDRSGAVSIYGKYAPPGGVESEFIRFPDEASAQEALIVGEIGHYAVIGPSYLADGAVKVVSLPQEGVSGLRRPPLRRWLLANLSQLARLTPSLEARMEEPYKAERAVFDPSLRFVRPDRGPALEPTKLLCVLLALIFLFTIFVPAGFLFQSVLDERNTRLMELMLSAVTPLELLVGKMLSGLGAGLLPLVVWGVLTGAPAAIGFFIYVMDVPVDFARLGVVAALGLVYVLLGIFFYGSLFVGIGVIGNSPREAQQIIAVLGTVATLPLVLVASALLGGSMESSPIRLVSLIPLFTPTLMVARIAFQIPSLLDLLATVLLMAASSYGAMR